MTKILIIILYAIFASIEDVEGQTNPIFDFYKMLSNDHPDYHPSYVRAPDKKSQIACDRIRREAIPESIVKEMMECDTIWKVSSPLYGDWTEYYYYNGKCYGFSKPSKKRPVTIYSDDKDDDNNFFEFYYVRKIATGQYGICYHTRYYSEYFPGNEENAGYTCYHYMPATKFIKIREEDGHYEYKCIHEIYDCRSIHSLFEQNVFKIEFMDDYQYTKKDVDTACKAKESDERRHPARYLLFDLYGASSTINKYRHTDEARQTVCAALVYGLRYDTYARNKFQRRKDTIRRLAIPEDIAGEIVHSDTIWVETPLPGRVLMDDYSWRELYYYGDGKCFGFTYDRYKNKVELRLVTHTDADSPVFDCIKRVAAGKYGVSYHTRYYSACSDEANIDNYRRALKEYTYVTKYVKVGARKGRNIYRYADGVFERKFSDSSVNVNGEVVYPFELYKIQFLDNYEYPDPYR